MDIENIEVRTSMVFFIFVDYLFSKYTYLTSMNEMTSMKINTNT
jgi:hypothetical protein